MDQNTAQVLVRELEKAYDYFNAKLFASQLPDCFISLRENNNSLGYFSPKRFASTTGKRIDEIAMNARYFATRSLKETLSTLVHEQCHLWQHKFGKPSRPGYHNKEWEAKMTSLGLKATCDGQLESKGIGDKVTHIILPAGPFDLACDQLLDQGFELSWHDYYAQPYTSPTKAAFSPKPVQTESIEFAPPRQKEAPSAPTRLEPAGKTQQEMQDPDQATYQILKPETSRGGVRSKYRCDCGHQLWAKPNLDVICGQCKKNFRELA